MYENNSCAYAKCTYDKAVCEYSVHVFYVITLVSFIELHWHFDSAGWCSTHALRKLLPDKVYRLD